jgi:hypothetical protein
VPLLRTTVFEQRFDPAPIPECRIEVIHIDILSTGGYRKPVSAADRHFPN